MAITANPGRSRKSILLGGPVKHGVTFGVALTALLVTLAGCRDFLLEPLVEEKAPVGDEPAGPAPSPTPGSPSAHPVGIYDRVSPSSIPGTQRYVFYRSTFSLQYVRPDWGFFEYTGRHSQADSLLTFDFDGWSVLGPWLAEGVLRGDTVTVNYNSVMLWNDFEDGVFVRDTSSTWGLSNSVSP